jgi:hypothetical protein
VPVIANLVEPHRVTRIFFDRRDAPPDPVDERRIERAIEQSVALDQGADDNVRSGMLSLLAA